MERVIKLGLSVLFLLCLFRMPYGYYQMVRFLAMLGFAFLAYFASEEKHQGEFVLYVFLAIFFQPLWKIALGRTLWNILDVVIAVGFAGSLFCKK